MTRFLAVTCIVTGAMLAGGCATKKYVRQTTAPISAKVDQVGEQTAKHAQDIQETRATVKEVDERAQSGISAAQERAAAAEQQALTADKHAGEARARADQAAQTADRNTQMLASVQQAIGNLDDYRVQTEVTIPFQFDRHQLTPQAKEELDTLAKNVGTMKRYFIAVEGYTDRTGSREYNEALSRRRADAVVRYLVANHDVPVYRIHMIGLGPERPAEEGTNRAANAKNRRVEVRLYSADQAVAQASTTSAMPQR
jgi:OOP family OmpA-OmpF porin